MSLRESFSKFKKHAKTRLKGKFKPGGGGTGSGGEGVGSTEAFRQAESDPVGGNVHGRGESGARIVGGHVGSAGQSTKQEEPTPEPALESETRQEGGAGVVDRSLKVSETRQTHPRSEVEIVVGADKDGAEGVRPSLSAAPILHDATPGGM